MTRDVLIGAGGHARVVYDALRQGGYDPTGLDVRGNTPGVVFYDRPVLVPEIDDDMAGHRVHVAIGHNGVRADLLARAQDRGGHLWTIIHPTGILAQTAHIGGGCLVAAGAILGPDAKIDTGCILNHGCVVDHDCRLGRSCHIAPGAVLGGGVSVGDGVLIGANSTVLPGVTIGSNVIIGAGSIVTKNVPTNSTWVGTSLRSQ